LIHDYLCSVGKPTFIVPFFGDQPFWGAACHNAGVGPRPVPIDELNTDRIVEAFKILILPL
jgi:UDP:flavonoid glycosyltransferase YjiC (YdhE family)